MRFSHHGELVSIRLARQQINIPGVISSLPRHSEYAVQWLEKGKVDVEGTAPHSLALDDVKNAS